MSRWNHTVRTIAMSALLISVYRAEAQGPATETPPSLLSAIDKSVPNATPITLADVDMKGCDPVPKSPGLVQADFNGDSRLSYAVLLKAGETGKVVDWQGTKLKQTRYVLALFLDDGMGGFTFKPIHRFEDFSPIAAYIDLQRAGSIKSTSDNRTVVIHNPGVSLVFCEKSEAVYYISGNRVRTVWVGD